MSLMTSETQIEPKNETTRLIVDRLWCVSDATADGYETVRVGAIRASGWRRIYAEDPGFENAAGNWTNPFRHFAIPLPEAVVRPRHSAAYTRSN
jgi:hypothetical protein